MADRPAPAPLRAVLWLTVTALGALVACGARWALANGCGDWRVFAAAGARVGTRGLLEPREAWETYFYLPASAWALAPVAHLPLATSFLANAALMIACAAGAGVVAVRGVCGSRAPIVALCAMWAPVVYAAAIVGQNAALGLLLAQLAIAGLASRSVVLTALPVGLLLYKPTYALPLLIVLAVRGRRRELAVVAALGVVWYAASVPAAGGDWAWPAAWMRQFARFAAGDFGVNAPAAVSLPALLMRAGAGAWATGVVTLAAAIACARAFRRVSPREAGCAACLAGIALGTHAWAYDAVFALPMATFVASRLAEPARTRLLLAVALAGPGLFFAPLLGFDPLAPVVVGATAGWLARTAFDPGPTSFAFTQHERTEARAGVATRV